MAGMAKPRSSALANLEDAEARHADAVALLQILDEVRDQIFRDLVHLLLRHLVLLGEISRDVLQGDGGL